MKKLLSAVLIMVMVFQFNSIVFSDMGPTLTINKKDMPHTVKLSNFAARLEFGDVVCEGNISDSEKGRVPLYIIGLDEQDNIVEAAGYTFDTNIIFTKQQMRLRAGFQIKKIEIGYMPDNNDRIELLYYGIRRDDQQNKIIVTAALKNNSRSSYPNDKIKDKSYGGIVAVGEDTGGRSVEVQSGNAVIPNGGGGTVEVAFLAGSMINEVQAAATGNGTKENDVYNVYGTRVEKGKTIITGSVENNPYSQYIQVVASGYSKGKVVQIEGQTLAVDVHANKSYRFEMNENNNIENVEVKIRKQRDITGQGEIVTQSWPRVERNKLVVDALVSSGYYMEKNLGIIATGYDKPLGDSTRQALETNSAVMGFAANKCEMKKVQVLLDAGDKIKPENVSLTLAGDLQDEYKLRNYAYRVENGTYVVSSVLENGNTVPQSMGVQITGYDKNGKEVEITGYSSLMKANTTAQFKTMLRNSQAITRINVELIDVVRDNVTEKHTVYKDEDGITVSGILLSGSRKHNAGMVVTGKDAGGKTVDADCFYGLLAEDSLTPVYLKLNDAAKIAKIDSRLIDESSLKPVLALEGSGSFVAQGKVKINGIVSNGTTLDQQAGLISMGYDANNRLVDIDLGRIMKISPLSLTKVENSLNQFEKIKTVKSMITGLPCKTSILGQTMNVNNNIGEYKICIANGAGDQDFTIQVVMYDKKGKAMAGKPQTLPIKKYQAGVYRLNFYAPVVSKITVKVLDASRKQLKNPLYPEVLYPGKI